MQVTLIDVQSAASYSGMVPGCVSGLYQPEDTLLQLQPLSDWAGIDFVNDKVVDIDLEQKVIYLGDPNKEPIEFDVVSLDIGSTSRNLNETKGALDYTIPTRPISQLVTKMEDATSELVENPRRVNLVVIGGGAAGIELAMSIHGRWDPLQHDVHVTLLDSGPGPLLPNESEANRNALRQIMDDKDIVIRHNCHVEEICQDHVVLMENNYEETTTIPFTHCVWATGAGAHTLATKLADRGLATTDYGWIRVNESFQSLSHPYVFAAGDCCNLEGLPGGRSLPKAGVFAVRAGPILIENLSKMLLSKKGPAQKEELIKYHPQDDFLKLLITGDGKAIGFRFGIPFFGKWVFEMKNEIDQSFMDLFRANKLPPKCQPKDLDSDSDTDSVHLDTSQYDAQMTGTEKPPRLTPKEAAILIQRTDDEVDFRKAWSTLREMAADETYKAEVLKCMQTVEDAVAA